MCRRSITTCLIIWLSWANIFIPMRRLEWNQSPIEHVRNIISLLLHNHTTYPSCYSNCSITAHVFWLLQLPSARHCGGKLPVSNSRQCGASSIPRWGSLLNFFPLFFIASHWLTSLTLKLQPAWSHGPITFMITSLPANLIGPCDLAGWSFGVK